MILIFQGHLSVIFRPDPILCLLMTIIFNICSLLKSLIYFFFLLCIFHQEFLFRAKPRKREFYIGLTDQVVEKQWEWVDGTPLIQSLR